jgi:hypothetical protein
MYKFLSILFLIGLLASGCKKPDPNPQLTDYIYQDIQRKLSDSEKLKEAHETNYSDFLSKSKSTDLQSREHKALIQKAYTAKWATEKTQQKINYYKMLLLEREKFVKRSYLKSFSKDEKWDNSDELRLYKKSAKWEQKLSIFSSAPKDLKGSNIKSGQPDIKEENTQKPSNQ